MVSETPGENSQQKVHSLVMPFLGQWEGFFACAEGWDRPGKTEKADFSANFAGNTQNPRQI